MVSPLIHCQFCPGILLCRLSPGRHTWTRIGSLESFCGLQLWLPALRSVDRTPVVPMLLGAAAFAALESDAYHHTLPACRQVVFAHAPVDPWDLPGVLHTTALRSNRPLFRSSPLFALDSSWSPPRKLAAFGTGREVQRVP